MRLLKMLLLAALFAAILTIPMWAQDAPKPAIFSLTFDDGFQSAYDKALPILDSTHLKATWFVITGVLGSPTYMTRDEVVALDKDGQELGCHTMTHPNLADLTMLQQQNELQGSENYLNGLLGHAPLAFAYPYGSRNSDTVELLQQNGYTTARTVDWGANLPGTTDPLELHSYSMDATSKLDDAKADIDNAPAGSWVIFVFHRVGETGNSVSVDPQFLRGIADYLVQKHAIVLTQTEGWKVFHGRR